MRLYEVFNPDLDIYVRYRMLTPEEIECLLLEYSEEGREKFARAVLEMTVHNLKDVTQALRRISKDKAKEVLGALFNGCLMLNPDLDGESWYTIAIAPQLVMNHTNSRMKSAKRSPQPVRRGGKARKITRTKFLNLERHLKERVIGQDEAIEELVRALRRSQAGLNDEERPLGVFLLAGASGVGKTHLARELHRYLFDGETEPVRVDCGEFQHKHENQKLIGAPPGYLGHDEGGALTNELAKNPHTVVLIDEVEKAHPDIFNTFLRVFDEGMLTDGNGKKVSFRDAVIIMTTNLGNENVVQDLTTRGVGFAKLDRNMPQRDRVVRLAREAIQKQFRPEFLNRIDTTIIFNHLQQEDYIKIAELELGSIQSKLEKRGFALAFDQSVAEAMVRDGVSHVQGARKLAQLRRNRIEDPLAELMLSSRFPRGTTFQIFHDADGYRVSAQRPAVKKRTANSSCSLEVVAPA